MKEALCIPRFAFDDAGTFQGFQHYPSPSYFLRSVLHSGPCDFRDRALVETDPSFKQLIPYVVCRDEDGRVLLYTRSGKVGDGRLRSKSSIGVGGHVERKDRATYEIHTADYLMATLAFAAVREIREELGVSASISDLKLRGLINDDSDDVGRVHLGVVYEVAIPRCTRFKDCNELQSREWAWPEDLRGLSNLESWSKLTAIALFNVQPEAASR